MPLKPNSQTGRKTEHKTGRRRSKTIGSSPMKNAQDPTNPAPRVHAPSPQTGVNIDQPLNSHEKRMVTALLTQDGKTEDEIQKFLKNARIKKNQGGGSLYGQVFTTDGQGNIDESQGVYILSKSYKI